MSGPAMVPWTEVYPDDQVAGADGMAWTVLEREQRGARVKVTIVRDGRTPISRTDPPGTVLCRRGGWGQQVASAIATLRAGGFVVM